MRHQGSLEEKPGQAVEFRHLVIYIHWNCQFVVFGIRFLETYKCLYENHGHL